VSINAYKELAAVLVALSGAVSAVGLTGLAIALLRAQAARSDEARMAGLAHVGQIFLFMSAIGALGLIVSWLWSAFADPAAAGRAGGAYFLRYLSMF
jgi:hypothetical protein